MIDNMDDLFADNCFLPCVGEAEQQPRPLRKDLDTLLKELNSIEQNLDEINAKKEYLAKLVSLHMGVIPD